MSVKLVRDNLASVVTSVVASVVAVAVAEAAHIMVAVEDKELRGNRNRARVKRSVKEEEGSTSAQVVAVDRDKGIVVANTSDFTAGKPNGGPNGKVRGGHK